MSTYTENPTVNTRRLGTQGPRVTSPGLGAMSMSGAYGPTRYEESIAAIHSYVDAGEHSSTPETSTVPVTMKCSSAPHCVSATVRTS